MTYKKSPRFLICRLSAVGDCIHALPLLCALRDHYPKSLIAWAVHPGAAPLLEGHAALDELIVVDRRELTSPRGLWRLRRRLRSRRFDVAIDPQSLSKSAIVARLSGAPRRIGFGVPQGRELSRWLNNRQVTPIAGHVIDRYLQLLRPLDIDAGWVRFDVPEDERAQAAAAVFIRDAHLALGFAVLNPGAGWDSRLWPAERYAQVARHLGTTRQLPSVVVWSGERELAWAHQIVGRSGGQAILAPATTLPELAALLRRARLVVASDTGPLHLAVAVGTLSVALHGTTRPEDTGPYGPSHIALQETYDGGTSRRRRRADNKAMQAIRVEYVCAACELLLDRGDLRRPVQNMA